MLFRPLVGRLLINTIALIVAASATTAVIGAATAWLIERTDLPGRKVWAVLAVAPLAIPPFISSFAWVSLSDGLQDFAGALLVVTCAYYPLVYLPVAAALRGLDPALEETARSLGQTSWGCFFRVVLPQLRPALYGGVLLVALDTLNEFGAFALLRFETFTTEIYAQYQDRFRRTRDVPVGCRPPRALHRLSGRRNESARAQTLRARRRGNAAQLSIGAAGLDTMAGADRVRSADPRDAGDAIGHGRLLADATRLGGDFAPRRRRCRVCSTRRWHPSAMVWPERPRPFCWRRLWAISQRAIQVAGPSSWSGSPIWRKACRASWWRWR